MKNAKLSNHFLDFSAGLERSLQNMDNEENFRSMQEASQFLQLNSLIIYRGNFDRLGNSINILSSQITYFSNDYWDQNGYKELTPEKLEVLQSISANYSQLESEISDTLYNSYSRVRNLKNVHEELAKMIDDTVRKNNAILNEM